MLLLNVSRKPYLEILMAPSRLNLSDLAMLADMERYILLRAEHFLSGSGTLWVELSGVKGVCELYTTKCMI